MPYRFVVRSPGISAGTSAEIKKEAGALMEKASKFIGRRPSGPFFIYIAADRDQFALYAGEGTPDWAVAIYLPEKRSVVVKPAGFKTDPAGFAGILQHELVHAALENMFRNHSDALPRWLNEGLAMYISGAWEAPVAWNVRKTALYAALRKGSAIDFGDLESDFPFGNLMAQMAYTQSYDLTQYLLDNYGEKRMRRLLALLASGTPSDSAWRKVYNKSFNEIVVDWKRDVERPGGLIWLMHFLADFNTYIWGLMAILVIVGAIRVRSHVIRKRPPAGGESGYDPDNDWDELDEEWDPDTYGYRPWRPGKRH